VFHLYFLQVARNKNSFKCSRKLKAERTAQQNERVKLKKQAKLAHKERSQQGQKDSVKTQDGRQCVFYLYVVLECVTIYFLVNLIQ